MIYSILRITNFSRAESIEVHDVLELSHHSAPGAKPNKRQDKQHSEVKENGRLRTPKKFSSRLYF